MTAAMTRRTCIALAALTALLALALVPPPARTSAAAPVLTTGAVVALRGTPHLYVVDANGAIHWSGDTRALQERYVDWSTRNEVSLEDLKALLRGDPWLSAGLLKNGEPIYLVKWETGDDKPTLLHIQSIQDVEVFGINANNYGSFVIDRSAWEQRFGFAFDSLQKGELARAVGTATPTAAATATQGAATATATPSGLTATVKEVTVSGDKPVNYTVTTKIDVSGLPPRAKVMVWLVGREYECSPECDSTKPVSWGPTDAFGEANGSGVLRIEDKHKLYSEYTYTIKDAQGRTVTVKLDSDFLKVD